MSIHKLKEEQEKLNLVKKRFDTYVAIVRDISLIIAILTATAINMFNGTPKQVTSSPAPASVQIEYRSAQVPVLNAVNAPRHHDKGPISTILWIVVGLSIGLLVIPRVRKKKHTTKKD